SFHTFTLASSIFLYRRRNFYRDGKGYAAMPDGQGIKAQKVLEINMNHDIFNSLKAAFEADEEKLALYTNLLYNQAMLIEGLPIDDPVDFSNDICKVML